MDSFSLDENANVSFSIPDTHQSTPKRKRKKENVPKKTYVCNVCQKIYQMEFYYQKHLLSHDSQKDVPALNECATPNVSSTSYNLTENNLSLSILSTSVAPAAAPAAAGNNFKVPAVPRKKLKVKKPKVKPNFVCTYCLKPYMSLKIFQNHSRIHILQEAFRRFPSKVKILENIGDIGTEALTGVSNCVAFGINGLKFRELVGHVIKNIDSQPTQFEDFCSALAGDLVDSIVDKMAQLPSAFIGTLLEKMEEILDNDSLCFDYLSKLSVEEFDCDTQSQFFLEFIMNLTLGIFKFISRTYREFHPPRATQVHLLDPEEKQVIFYIGGSIMRGYLKMGKRNKTNDKWQKIVSVLTSRVLCDKPEGDLLDAQWTADVDRGGLLYVRVPVQEFFKRVAVVIYGSEHADGSIDYEEVITKVSKSSITCDWDDIIQDSLPESMSVNLMNDVVTYFCKAIGRGIAKRRINEKRKKPVISMATRVSVATRKK